MYVVYVNCGAFVIVCVLCVFVCACGLSCVLVYVVCEGVCVVCVWVVCVILRV